MAAIAGRPLQQMLATTPSHGFHFGDIRFPRYEIRALVRSATKGLMSKRNGITKKKRQV
jgi:hypothetical protein